jgi:hypothetical protein
MKRMVQSPYELEQEEDGTWGAHASFPSGGAHGVGDTLQQFRRLLDEVAAAAVARSELALDLRRGIGMLLLSEGDSSAAQAVFAPLYDDHVAVYGRQDERSREIAEILARIRFSEASIE